MNILHVISSMAQEAGGPPGVCAGLAGALAGRGHEVTIAAVKQPNTSPVTIAQAVRLETFRADQDTGRTAAYAKSALLDDWLGRHVPSFDIVHLHALWQFPTFAAARACRRANVPYVVMPHGMLDTYSIGQRSAWKKRIYWLLRERQVEGGARALHCLNRAEIRRAVSWIRTMPKFVLPNGIAASELDQVPGPGAFRSAHPELGDRPLALFLSRLHPKKGLDRLLPAWKRVAVEMPDARLAIAGTGEPAYLAALDQAIAAHGLAGKVVRVGQLQGRSKWQALVDADVFVLPSHQEGFSMAITEALGAGCACVITEECNFDEVRDAGCGIVVPNGDMDAFVQGVMDLLADNARRRPMGAAARQLVRDRYTWEKIAEDLDLIYQWILAGKTFPPCPPGGEDAWQPGNQRRPAV